MNARKECFSKFFKMGEKKRKMAVATKMYCFSLVGLSVRTKAR
jgi:hypothetical protein